jgi:hypothetical protein
MALSAPEQELSPDAQELLLRVEAVLLVPTARDVAVQPERAIRLAPRLVRVQGAESVQVARQVALAVLLPTASARRVADLAAQYSELALLAHAPRGRLALQSWA